MGGHSSGQQILALPYKPIRLVHLLNTAVKEDIKSLENLLVLVKIMVNGVEMYHNVSVSNPVNIMRSTVNFIAHYKIQIVQND